MKQLLTVIRELDKRHQTLLEERNLVGKRASNFKCFHPEHGNDTNPSASFVPNAVGKIHCFGCGKSWNIDDSYAFLEGSPRKGEPGWLEETILPLAKHFNIPANLEELSSQDKDDLLKLRLYKDIADYLTSNTEVSPSVSKEIKKRKWKDQVIKDTLQAGTVKSYEDLLKHLRSLDYSDQVIDNSDASREDIFNPDNIIFPIKDVRGNIIAFNARNTSFQKDQHNQVPKWIHSSTSTLFIKSKVLFGSNLLSKLATAGKTTSAYIVEGTGDWISLYQAGVKNVVCSMGTALTEQHFDLIRRLGIPEIDILFDNDDAGRKACSLVAKNYEQFRGIKVYIVQVGEDGQDIEDYLKSHSINDFWQQQKKIHFLEWLKNHYQESGLLEDDIVANLCSVAAGEADPLIIHRYSDIVTELTGLPSDVIRNKVTYIKDQLDQKIELKKESAVTQAIHRLREKPTDAKEIATNLVEVIETLDKAQGETVFGYEECLAALTEQENLEQTKPAGIDGFTLKRHTKLQNILYGAWRQKCLMLLAGKANVGKTNMLTDLALDIVMNNDGICLDPFGAPTKKTTVVYYSNDDPRSKIINRMATNLTADLMPSVTFNMISNPEHYIHNAGAPTSLLEDRQAAYNIIRRLIAEERLLFKDIKQGTRVEYLRAQLAWLRRRYPDPDEHPIVLVIDNLSKTETEQNVRDQAEARKISEAAKKWTNLYDITIMASVEYPKLLPGSRPTDSNLRDTEQLRYDADLIFHFINDFAENSQSDLFWRGDKDYNAIEDPSNPMAYDQWPIAELFLTKNKITQYKNISIFYDMIPVQARFRQLTRETLQQRQIASIPAAYIKPVPQIGEN